MNFSYSFTVPESLLVIALIAAAMFSAVCILMFIDIWREVRNMRRQKNAGYIQRIHSAQRRGRA